MCFGHADLNGKSEQNNALFQIVRRWDDADSESEDENQMERDPSSGAFEANCDDMSAYFYHQNNIVSLAGENLFT